MRDALEELLTAIGNGDALAWLLRYAPDGDRDAAVKRAWNECQNEVTLSCALFDAGRSAGYYCRAAPECRLGCPYCVQSFKSQARCPDWHELIAVPLPF